MTVFCAYKIVLKIKIIKGETYIKANGNIGKKSNEWKQCMTTKNCKNRDGLYYQPLELYHRMPGLSTNLDIVFLNANSFRLKKSMINKKLTKISQ